MLKEDYIYVDGRKSLHFLTMNTWAGVRPGTKASIGLEELTIEFERSRREPDKDGGPKRAFR